MTIRSLAYDSRRVKQGSLFFAIRGLKSDGHRYIKEALIAGAAGIVVEEWQENLPGNVIQIEVPDSRLALALAAAHFYGHPSSKLQLIGVTGTNGKTTTSYLIERIFAAAGKKTGLIGTIEYKIAGRSHKAERTTPESLDLQKMLGSMVDAGVEVAVMEVSSHAAELKRVDGCEFTALVFTNLTQDHLDFHGDMEDYFQAKSRLFKDPRFSGALHVINADDMYGQRLCRISGSCQTYGFSDSAQVRGVAIEQLKDGLHLDVSSSSGALDIKTAMNGIFNGDNILASVAAAQALSVPDQAIVEALSQAGSIPGRFDSVDLGQDFQVIVDYAHTPDGLRRVLEAARAAADGMVITVFGCGGDRDPGKRPLMGKVVAELSDRAIITSDNPRSESAEKIIAEIEAGMRSGKAIYDVVADRYLAINEAINRAEKGDLVLIAGKGHETGQIFSDKVVPFDDRLAALEILVKIKNDASKSA